jgi:hypothetical protein
MIEARPDGPGLSLSTFRSFPDSCLSAFLEHLRPVALRHAHQNGRAGERRFYGTLGVLHVLVTVDPRQRIGQLEVGGIQRAVDLRRS